MLAKLLQDLPTVIQMSPIDKAKAKAILLQGALEHHDMSATSA
jgi:hypothetical protein